MHDQHILKNKSAFCCIGLLYSSKFTLRVNSTAHRTKEARPFNFQDTFTKPRGGASDKDNLISDVINLLWFEEDFF